MIGIKQQITLWLQFMAKILYKSKKFRQIIVWFITDSVISRVFIYLFIFFRKAVLTWSVVMIGIKQQLM